MEYVDGGNWLTDKAEALLLSVVGCFIYDAVKPYMIKAAIAAAGWVKAAVVSAAGWVVANPGVAIGILAGVAGFTAGWIACRYHLRKK